MNPSSRPQSATTLPRDGLKKPKKRATNMKPVIRKSLLSSGGRKATTVTTPLIPSLTEIATGSKELPTSRPKGRDDASVSFPSPAWTSKHMQARPKTAPSKARTNGKKGQTTHKKLLQLPKKIDSFSPSMLVDAVFIKIPLHYLLICFPC